MARRNIIAVAVGLTCAALGYGAPAAAYRVDPKTQEISITSLADYDKCENDTGGANACLDALRTYLKTHQKDAFDAGKHVRLQRTHWAALEFFAPVFAKKPPKDACADPDVSAAVLSGFELPSDYPAVAQAKKVAEACWEQVQPKLSAELKGTSGYLHDNLCPPLATKGVNATQCQPVVEKPKVAPASTALAELKGVDWKKLQVDPESGLSFRSANGEELLFARAKSAKPAYVLLKFKSVRGPWNQQVLVAVERNGGRGKDYVVAVDGKEWVALTERDGQYEAYPKGVPDSLWMRPVSPVKESKPPTRQEIANEFAAAAKPAK